MPSCPEEFFVRKDAKVLAMWFSSTREKLKDVKEYLLSIYMYRYISGKENLVIFSLKLIDRFISRLGRDWRLQSVFPYNYGRELVYDRKGFQTVEI